MKTLKTIDIKGKQYVQVSERVRYFNEAYPDGSITTELVSPLESEHIIIKATVRPASADIYRTFTGYSQATVGDGYINKTSALENAETSAVGRALGFMGIGVVESIASADEIHKAQGSVGKSDDPFGEATRLVQASATIDDLMKVAGRIAKSKSFTEEQKKALSEKVKAKSEELQAQEDPTVQI